MVELREVRPRCNSANLLLNWSSAVSRKPSLSITTAMSMS